MEITLLMIFLVAIGLAIQSSNSRQKKALCGQNYIKVRDYIARNNDLVENPVVRAKMQEIELHMVSEHSTSRINNYWQHREYLAKLNELVEDLILLCGPGVKNEI